MKNLAMLAGAALAFGMGGGAVDRGRNPDAPRRRFSLYRSKEIPPFPPKPHGIKDKHHFRALAYSRYMGGDPDRNPEHLRAAERHAEQLRSEAAERKIENA